jgi:hypothetical protein
MNIVLWKLRRLLWAEQTAGLKKKDKYGWTTVWKTKDLLAKETIIIFDYFVIFHDGEGQKWK